MEPVQLSAADRVLVAAPHPDDETLGAGGLLQRAAARGAAVRVCYATSGENNPWAQRAFEHRLVIGAPERARFGALRPGEARLALARLGLDLLEQQTDETSERARVAFDFSKVIDSDRCSRRL